MNDNNASDGRQDLVLLWCYKHTCERVWLYLKSGGGLVVNVYCKQAIIKVTIKNYAGSANKKNQAKCSIITKKIRNNIEDKNTNKLKQKTIIW